MAALLTLDEAKLHCRIDHNDEDSLLGALIATATTAVADYLNVTTVDSTAAAPVKSAALLLVGDLYANREAQATGSSTRTRLLRTCLTLTGCIHEGRTT